MTGQDEMNLATLARALDAGADRLREYMEQFEGGVTSQGEVVVGVKALYEEAVAQEADEILKHYEREEKRPPAEATRTARAVRHVKERDPNLYSDYHRLAGSIATGQRWLSNKRAAISALQTLNKTGRDLAGMS